MIEGLGSQQGVNEESNSLGFTVLDSGLYDCKIMKAFITKSAKKATAVNLTLKTSDGKTFNQQLWVTSNEDKGCKNYYEGKNKEKHYLPGFNMANAICLLAAKTAIGDMSTEPGVEEVYGEKTKVDTIVGLAGLDITLGIIRQRVNKRVKNDNDEYVDSPETRDENEIDKVFRATDGLTVPEIRGGLTEAKFKEQWDEKWTGELRDRSKNTSGAAEGAPQQAVGTDAGATGGNAALFK
jgi:hypothetical protein